MRRLRTKCCVFVTMLLAVGLFAAEPVFSHDGTDETASGYRYDGVDRFFLLYDGFLRTGGQAGDDNHVMVAAEINAKAPGINVSELKPGMRMYTPQDVVHIVAHKVSRLA